MESAGSNNTLDSIPGLPGTGNWRLVGMATEVTAFFVDSVPTVVVVETARTGFGRIGIKPPTATRILLRGDTPWLHWDIYNAENITGPVLAQEDEQTCA
jgi:hypothetical protein